ncbi:hypothetical protein, partial [Frankia sp. AiPs1]|uniref:hypothetical protein n=1 Tax=Frankia sp. AiPs1 TaxID=573493 RepID=UPI0035AB94C9
MGPVTPGRRVPRRRFSCRGVCSTPVPSRSFPRGTPDATMTLAPLLDALIARPGGDPALRRAIGAAGEPALDLAGPAALR